MFIPEVPLEQSRDGQIFVAAPPIDVRHLFTSLENYGFTNGQRAALCTRLEAGETVHVEVLIRAAIGLDWSIEKTAGIDIWLRAPRELVGLESCA